MKIPSRQTIWRHKKRAAAQKAILEASLIQGMEGERTGMEQGSQVRERSIMEVGQGLDMMREQEEKDQENEEQEGGESEQEKEGRREKHRRERGRRGEGSMGENRRRENSSRRVKRRMHINSPRHHTVSASQHLGPLITKLGVLE